jgi:pantetheine-phosphate adenylyltransferase
MNEKLAIYPGTFDPLTNGHISIIKRALKIFDKLVLAILINPNKTPLFTLEERISMLKEIFGDEPNIEIDSFNGLLVDYAVKKKRKYRGKGIKGSL